LLLLRALFYWQIGSAANWTPKLNLFLVSLAFRNDSAHFWPPLLYSVLSFLQTLLIFYFWLVTLTFINRESADPDPLHKLLRLHLGRVARWPWALQWLLPPLAAACLWVALHSLLLRYGIVGPVRSLFHLGEQGLLLGFALLFSLKYLLPVLLLLYLVTSYVYFGSNPFWDFVGTTACNLLSPLRKLPLQAARFDFAPVVGAVLLLLVLHALPEYLLPKLFHKNFPLCLWPQ
jgi:uncharacterized protein YggT (Ycf19 family)